MHYSLLLCNKLSPNSSLKQPNVLCHTVSRGQGLEQLSWWFLFRTSYEVAVRCWLGMHHLQGLKGVSLLRKLPHRAGSQFVL